MQTLLTEDSPSGRRTGNDRSEGTTRLRTWVIAAVVAAVALVVGAVVGAVGFGDGSDTRAADATGTLVVRPSGPPASMDQDGDRIQFRDLTLRGTITVTTEDGERTGEIAFRELEDITLGPSGPVDGIAHVWGTATATLDGVSCEGPFAAAKFPDAGDDGGSLTLHCDDGSLLGGELREAKLELAPDGFLEQLTRSFEGWAVFVD